MIGKGKATAAISEAVKDAGIVLTAALGVSAVALLIAGLALLIATRKAAA